MTRATRTYLRGKAVLGRWDKRYLTYYRGIPATLVTAGVKGFVMRGFARGLVVTATTNGTHAPNSFHTSGKAADMGLVESEIGTAKGRRRMGAFQRAEYEAWRRGRRPHMRELIGPINDRVVLAGNASPLAEGTPLEDQHDNHVHGAFV